MSAPRLPSLRPTGGGGHLLQLVRNASLGLPTTSRAGAIWAARQISHSARPEQVKHTVVQRDRQLRSISRYSSSRPYGASAFAVAEPDREVAHYYTRPPLYSASHAQPPSSTRDHPKRAPIDPPPWTQLPQALEQILTSPQPTPSDFRSSFESSNSQPYHLARLTTLEQVWSIWSAQAEPSNWAWLAGQLGNILAMEDVGELEKGLVPMMQSIRAYAVAQLGQSEEARTALSNIRGNKSKGGTYAALIQAKTWVYLGKWEEARRQLVLATTGMIAAGKSAFSRHQSLDMMDDLVNAFKDQERWEELAEVVQESGGSLRTLMLSSTDRRPLAKEDRRIVGLWLGALRGVEDPARWLARRLDEGNKDTRWMGTMFLTALSSGSGQIDRCIEMLDLVITERLPLPASTSVKLLSTMTAAEQPEITSKIVNHLSNDLTSLPHSALSALLEHHSRANHDLEASQVWNILSDQFQPTLRDKFNFLRRSIDLSNPEATEIQLRQFFGSSDHPDALYLLLSSHIQANDIESARDTFDRLIAIRPTIQNVNKMLALYASNIDSDSAVELFDQMAEYDLIPNIASYTCLISLFANTRDVENARNVFGLMEDSGIQPDASAYSAILNAEVECGEWTSAARRWNAIPQHLHDRPDIISVILKAYVLLSIPTERVIQIFRRVASPTSYLYSLAIQSAVDNDDFQLAHSLLEEMSSSTSSQSPKPSTYHYSILLHGYMRTGRRTESRAIYDEMLDQGILPSSVTYGMIMGAFRQMDGQSGYEQAMRFASSIKYSAKQLSTAPRGRQSGWENLYGPLVSMSGQAGLTGKAEEYLELARSETPTIPLYTRLMDAYRQAGRTDSVLVIWDKAFELACSSSRKTTSNILDGIATSRVKDNILCIPLSITLDSLAAAGRYLDIRRVWDSVQSAGFGFDAQNYNHYATALARTGDIDRAFSIVENILLPRWEEIKERRVIAMRESKFGILPPSSESPSIADIPVPPPKRNRRHEQRYGLRSITTDGPREKGIDMDLMKHWRPTDVLWKPSLLTLSVLEHAYSQVQDLSRSSWMALASSEDEPEPDSEGGEEVRLKSFGNVPIRDTEGEVKKTTPRAVLFRLNRKYTKVVALVMFHRRQRSSKRQQGI